MKAKQVFIYLHVANQKCKEYETKYGKSYREYYFSRIDAGLKPLPECAVHSKRKHWSGINTCRNSKRLKHYHNYAGLHTYKSQVTSIACTNQSHSIAVITHQAHCD